MAETPIIRNKLRGVKKPDVQSQPEYERLNVKPTSFGMPNQRKVNASREIPNQPRPTRGARMIMPPQANVAVGVNEGEMWADDNKVENPNEEKFIVDNNEYVDTEGLQRIKVNFKSPAQTGYIPAKNKLIGEPVEEYIVLLQGKAISDTISLSQAEQLIESVFFSDDGKDIGPEDFTVFKKVAVKIGVHIRE